MQLLPCCIYMICCPIIYIWSNLVLFCRVLFSEVLHTNQVFIRDLTVIEPSWLIEVAPHYFENPSLKTNF